ncbi:PAS domain containing protein [Nitzschia inconspicua]|uniref:histidine kinase n=1 Tax=Nitzschia inconspicua TaxID=303405 RepID=A0A9K3LXP9_9STRA|nr:PAS domain containing protein [Nitzschia inconspicua]
MSPYSWPILSSSMRFGTQTRSHESASIGSSGDHTRTSTNHGHLQTTAAQLASSSRKIKCGRFLFVLVLLVAAAVLGFGAYHIMDSAQTQMASDRFDSISDRALSVAQYVLEEKKRATDALALMMGSAHPNANVGWPMVALEGYEQIASSLGIVTNGSLSFCPIVIPGAEEQRLFEEFAYDLFEKNGFPPNTGISNFGKGIFSFGTGEFGNETWDDGRFHITSGWTYHNSSNNILVPFLQSEYGPHPSLMLNIHFEHNRAAAIDGIIKCSEERALTRDYRECGYMTDLMWSATVAGEVPAGPAGLMISPIYPRLDNTTLTGFIVTKQIWGDLLRYTFEPGVSGIYVVLYTENYAHTYRVTAGQIEYVGPGWEYHNPDAKFKVTKTRINDRFFANQSIGYYMDLYSSQEFMEIAGSFGNDNISNVPVAVCVAAVCIMLFTSLLFVLYDYWVQNEFNSRKRLLDAKRQFVRFISHEVRTPLNTICMGLTLLQHDLEAVLGMSNIQEVPGNLHVSFETMTETANGDEASNEECHWAEKPEKVFSNHAGSDGLTLKRKHVNEWRKLADQISKNAESAVNVLSDLLNYDKIQMGTLNLELSLVNLWKTLETTVNEFKMAANEKNVNLMLDFSPLMDLHFDRTFHGVRIFKRMNAEQSSMSESEVSIEDLPSEIRLFKVVADSVRLEQVFRNLLSNGLKFTKKNGNLLIRVTVKPNSRRRQKLEAFEVRKDEVEQLTRVGNVVVSVIDDGVGMTSDQVHQVFNDGTQFNANALQAGGGSGLGLSIARGLVTQHGGVLSCSSDGLGKGTTFIVNLPIYEEIGTIPAKDAESKQIQDSDQCGVVRDSSQINKALLSFPGVGEASNDFTIPSLRILVVDDALTNRKFCMRLLERAGHSTEGACDGHEGVEKVRESMEHGKPFDCILLDYEMPVMKGPKACEYMRKMGCSSFIVGVTGNVMSEDVDHFRNCGADWVLPKPFRLAALEQQWIEQGVAPHPKAGSEVTVTTSSLVVDLPDDTDCELTLPRSNMSRKCAGKKLFPSTLS